MNFVMAFQKGMELVGRHKRFVALAWLLNVVLVLVPFLLVMGAIRDSVGKSQVAETLTEGYSQDWYREFAVQAQGLAGSLDPTVSGPGALLNSLDDLLRGALFSQPLAILGLGVAYLLIWIFLSAGFMTSFQTGSSGDFGDFAAGAGRYLGRFFRLGVIGLVLFYLAYQGAEKLDWIFGEMTRQVVDERIAFLAALVKYIIFLAILFAIRIWMDYTKVVLVAEHRRSTFLAVVRALRFVWGNRGPVLLLGGSILSLFAVMSLIYAVAAPGAGSGAIGMLVWGALLAQFLIVGRIVIRVLSLASQWELYGMLAGSSASETVPSMGTGLQNEAVP